LIDAIGEYYKVKPDSDKEPEIYLGANVEKVQMPDGREVWATHNNNIIFKKRYTTSFSKNNSFVACVSGDRIN
jgi:hypothetical protein